MMSTISFIIIYYLVHAKMAVVFYYINHQHSLIFFSIIV